MQYNLPGAIIELTSTEIIGDKCTFMDKVNKAFAIANNAIYFNDNSDYLTALYEICETLHPAEYQYEDGEKFIAE